LLCDEKEGDMPIEELLAVYGCPLSHNLDDATAGGGDGMSNTSLIYGYNTGSLRSGGTRGDHNETYSSSEEEILSNQDLTLDKDEIARDLLMRNDTLDHETSVNDLITIIDLKSPGVSGGGPSDVKSTGIGGGTAELKSGVGGGLLYDQRLVTGMFFYVELHITVTTNLNPDNFQSKGQNILFETLVTNEYIGVKQPFVFCSRHQVGIVKIKTPLLNGVDRYRVIWPADILPLDLRALTKYSSV